MKLKMKLYRDIVRSQERDSHELLGWQNSKDRSGHQRIAHITLSSQASECFSWLSGCYFF